MDLATLKALKPREYADAADGYRRTSEMANAARDRIASRTVVTMRNALEGKAATAAVDQLTELAQNFHYIQTECGLIGSALDAFAYEMEAAKRTLDAGGGGGGPGPPPPRRPPRGAGPPPPGGGAGAPGGPRRA
ncbi:hypothetical protein [Streptomyces sp. CC224B]|uniref:hypothetical protein n=1 Tax=Streptomyces sp. CC224B TaxID=3044571 RepID=UPI0024A9CB5B|nr:hypothetical protein [Streptomyces sp. CC224B]